MSKNIGANEQDTTAYCIMEGVKAYGDYIYNFEDEAINIVDPFLIALDSPDAYKKALDKAKSISEKELEDYVWHIIFKRPHYSTPYFLLYSMISESYLTFSRHCELNEDFHDWLATYNHHEDWYSGSHEELEGLLNELCDTRFNKN